MRRGVLAQLEDQCRYDYLVGDVVECPTGKQAKLVALRADEQWDAKYMGEFEHWSHVTLQPKYLKLVWRAECSH